MDEDDRLMGYEVAVEKIPAKHSELTSPGKSKKSVPSENKAKPKPKKNNGKSWSAAAIGSGVGSGTGSKQVDASAFSFHRMRTLMKTQASVQNITHDATFLVAKATELFIRDIAYRMAEEALASNGLNGANKNGASSDHSLVVNYDHLAEIVHTNKRLDFLKEFVPHKVLAGQILPELVPKDALNSSSNANNNNNITKLNDNASKLPLDGAVIDLASDSP